MGLPSANIVFASVLGLVASCAAAPHKLISARRTPCRPREIEITQMTYSGSEEHWIATCKGKHYQCSTRELGQRLAYRCVLLKENPAQALDAGAL